MQKTFIIFMLLISMNGHTVNSHKNQGHGPNALWPESSAKDKLSQNERLSDGGMAVRTELDAMGTRAFHPARQEQPVAAKQVKSSSQAAVLGDELWSDRFYPKGPSATVNALVCDGEGNVYAGGEFVTVENVVVNHIARWDGSSWSALGAGTNGVVHALAIASDGALYAGGEFTTAGGVTANYIARWDGESWSALDTGMNGRVLALAALNANTLYAGGEFTMTGENEAKRIAVWNGTEWSSLDTGLNGPAKALVLKPDGTLFVGGAFSLAGDRAALFVARWNGSWSAVSTGMDEEVYALALSPDGVLYAGGYFRNADGESANRIAQWTGASWTALAGGTSSSVSALAVADDGTLYAGGSFSSADGNAASCIAKWDGAEWSALASGLSPSSVKALALSDDGRLFCGGNFIKSGKTLTGRIARWDGASWSGLGNGGDAVYGPVNVIERSVDGTLYIGGSFSFAGNTPANNIAKWNGTNWDSLGSGFRDPVVALALTADGTLYAAHTHTVSPGEFLGKVVWWNGDDWIELGSGMNNFIESLGLDIFGNVYAGGRFTAADGHSANGIAVWKDGNWNALGSGLGGEGASSIEVNSIIAHPDSGVYVGGLFTLAGGISVYGDAYWSGTWWHALGDGMGDTHAFALKNQRLYAAGWHIADALRPFNNIAEWDGTTWSAVGSDGPDDVIESLAATDSLIIAGGRFASSNYIKKWNGANWRAMGSGMDNWVLALEKGEDGSVYVGGNFTMAGAKASFHLAQWKPRNPHIALFYTPCTVGWNLSCSTVQPANPSLPVVVESVADHLILVKNGKGQVYWPQFQINQIGDWKVGDAYQIYLSSIDTLRMTGSEIIPEATPIELAAGWNMTSYLRDTPMPIETALASISADLVLAKNGAGQVYWPANDLNTIGDMQPGQGYQIYVNGACILTYPANDVIAKMAPRTRPQWSQSAYFTSYRTCTGANATILVSCSELPDGAEIGAWTAEHLLIGSGAIHQGKALITIWGDDIMTPEKDGAADGEKILLTVWRADLNQEFPLSGARVKNGLMPKVLSTSLAFQNNSVWLVETDGTRALPTEFSLLQNYPNPFNANTTIKYQLPHDTQMELVVYNLSGAKVQTLIHAVKKAGYHEITWNGKDDWNRPVSSGIYWIQMKAGAYHKVFKMSLIK